MRLQKDVMAALTITERVVIKQAAERAVEYADALIAELRKGE